MLKCNTATFPNKVGHKRYNLININLCINLLMLMLSSHFHCLTQSTFCCSVSYLYNKNDLYGKVWGVVYSLYYGYQFCFCLFLQRHPSRDNFFLFRVNTKFKTNRTSLCISETYLCLLVTSGYLEYLNVTHNISLTDTVS